MRIWSKQAFAKINQKNDISLQGYIRDEQIATSNFRVGIIGGGPKGAYALERLASIWQAYLPDQKLEIVCFNKDEHFGCGPNYLPKQPDFLLINYSLGNVNFWTDEAEQLVDDRTSLLDFINLYQEGEYELACEEDFCSRALTGIYLQHCLCQLITSLPDSISVHLVPNPVTAIDNCGNELILSTENGKYYSFSEVICCTGHSYSFQDETSIQIKKAVINSKDLTYLEHVYPITNVAIPKLSGKDLLIQGMGLTFVDAVLGLTEGLGGSFDYTENSLSYVPSGLEPARIYPFSRSGLPMLARNAEKTQPLTLRYFTEDFVEALLASGCKLSFEVSIYPIIEKEYRYHYINSLLHNYGFHDKNDTSLNLEELEYVAQTVIPAYSPFNPQNFLFPSLDSHSHHQAVIEYIEQSLSPAKFSLEIQATQELSGVWRAIYPLFRKLYNFGGLCGNSQKLMDQIYFGSFQRVSYGPPVFNMQKILALAKAGMVRFDIGPSPTLRINDDTQKFEISSVGLLKKIESNMLINARIAKIGGLDSQPPLFKHIQKKYRISPYQNDTYKPGCFELDREGVLSNFQGVTFNGTPTEGWTLDNESLSRTNNNFITPWANKLVTNYVNKISQINPYCTSLD